MIWTNLIKAAQLAGFKMEIAEVAFATMKGNLWFGDRKFSNWNTDIRLQANHWMLQRSSEQQKLSAILRWSALPGASRHHWGCDFDVFAHQSFTWRRAATAEPLEYLTATSKRFLMACP